MESYNHYLMEHVHNVVYAYEWLKANLPDIDGLSGIGAGLDYFHDSSKYGLQEFDAYDDYYYRKEKTPEVVAAYKKAWLHHIHNNPHHWQHWVLINDEEPVEALEMPDNYIIEMICDWWSFGWRAKNPRELFNWYKENKGKIVLHPNTRIKVELILSMIDKKLYEIEQNS